MNEHFMSKFNSIVINIQNSAVKLNIYAFTFSKNSRNLFNFIQFRHSCVCCNQKKKLLETINKLWYIKHKEGYLLVTGILQKLPIDG